MIPSHETILACPLPTNALVSVPFADELNIDLIQTQKALGAEYHYVQTTKTDKEILLEVLSEKYL